MQSVNLRAALFRVLTDLKKNGDLGKETILRKSMLDDCKGEKFEELLAVFSTNVLRRVWSGSMAKNQLNPALKMALASGVSAEEYSQLALPLLLAHRTSIAQSAERRTRVQGTFDGFSELLDSKEAQLEQRANERPQSDPEEPADLARVTQHVKTNWLGSGEWADLLLNGGSQSGNDAFLDLPFAQAWATAKELTVEDLQAGASKDLLLDLESRVAHQKGRLNKWRDYGDTAGGRNGHVASPSVGTTGKSVLSFKDHQSLTVASISKAVREPGQRASHTEDHRSLLLAMNESLASINGKSLTTETGSKERAVSDTSALKLEPNRESNDVPDEVPDEVPEVPEVSEVQPAQPPTPSYHEQIQQASPTVSISEPSPEDQPDPDIDPPVSLAERTQKSLSLLPPRNTGQSQPRDQEPSRRKSRMSLPVNQFETPKKKMPSRTPTPRDELFEEEADYASVFRSRPRIAQSPVSSPAVHVSPLSDFDLSGMDQDESSELGLDSPSVRR